MRLLIDIGNTRSKWALSCTSGVIQARGILGENCLFESDAEVERNKGQILEVWVSCVGKSGVLSRVTSMVERELGLTVNLAKVEPRMGNLKNNYSDLNRLGVDRWVAAIGARSKISNGSLIVVDAGTAVTIDYISNGCSSGDNSSGDNNSSGNSFEGGVILPGLVMMHDALVDKTAGIASELSDVKSVVGKTTQQCVNAGAKYGLVGAIERVVKEMMREKVDQNSVLVITGGDAKRIAPLSCLPFQLSDDVIFDGLNSIATFKNKQ